MNFNRICFFSLLNIKRCHHFIVCHACTWMPCLKVMCMMNLLPEDSTQQRSQMSSKQFRSFTLFASDDSNSSETSLADENSEVVSFGRCIFCERGRNGAADKARTTHAENDFAHIFWQTVCLSPTLRRTHDWRETRRYILHFLHVLTSYSVLCTTFRCCCWCHWCDIFGWKSEVDVLHHSR